MLAVGDSTRLDIIFDTKTYTDRVTKQPRIETNEGKPDKFVRISAQVVRRPDSTYPLVIKPYKLDISQFGEKRRDEMKFTVSNMSDKPLNLTRIAVPNDLLELSLPASVEAGKSVEGSIKLKPEAAEKSFEASMTLEVNDEAKSRFTVPIKRTRRVPGQAADTTKTASAIHQGHGH